MVVDAAIVVLENIYRHLQMGRNRFEAARDGTVLASTVTTVVVFLPIVFIQERADSQGWMLVQPSASGQRPSFSSVQAPGTASC